jgi:pseudaminic acid biosynthesis-associated methylase
MSQNTENFIKNLHHNLINEWSGDFGTDYTTRNASSWVGIKNRSRLFGDIFQAMETANKANPSPQPFPASVIEVGGGCGDNLRAIDMIYERSRQLIKLMSCDPNEAARKAMADVATAIPGDLSALPYADDAADLVFTSGVLIHVPPAELDRALSEIYRVSKRWILSIEYYNNVPEEISYRGQSGMMWRRDWGEAWLEKYPELRPIGNGFAWKRTTSLDNLHWFLFDRPQIPASAA